jgi:hypothetical protein
VTVSTGDFALTIEDLQAVVQYAADAAEDVLPVFESSAPEDRRPRAAIAAAHEFLSTGRRTKLQRTASLDAHRAAKDAPTEQARLAAQAAGDAAAAAYLHPLAKSSQVGHILRAAANAIRITELTADGHPPVTDGALRRWVDRASPELLDVLRRYPAAPAGRAPAARFMSALDTALRQRV